MVVFTVVLMVVVTAVFVGGVDPFGPGVHIDTGTLMYHSSVPVFSPTIRTQN